MNVAQDLTDWKVMELCASSAFWASSPEYRSTICNGAGAEGGFKFPNTFYGLNVRIAFDIHDWDYAFGSNALDKRSADTRMLVNLFRVIETQTTKTPLLGHILRFLRRRRAVKYYEAVFAFGDSAFFK